MIDRGYENVSVEDIAAAAGIGRTTFFRYFGSKSGVIWLEFDSTIERLADVLEASADADDVLGSVRRAVITKDATTLVEGGGDKAAVEGRVATIRREIEIDGAGEVAYVRGSYSIRLSSRAKLPFDKGKYLEVWRKQADESWKVIRHIYSSEIASRTKRHATPALAHA